MSLIALKLILTPTLIAAATLAERRWGARAGGLISGLPLTSGPVSLFLALEQGPEFAARAAHAMVLGPTACAAFAATYAQTSRSAGWPWCAAAGILAYGGAALALCGTTAPLAASATITGLAILLALRATPNIDADARPLRPIRFDIPLRALLATAMVVSITLGATALGPTGSGLLAPFPAFAGTMTTFAHVRGGRSRALGTLRGVLLGSFAFTGFFVALAAMLRDVRVLPAFAAAVVSALLVHAVVRIVTAPRPGSTK